MTRLNIAFVVPAGFLGCLTMSAALVVGHAEIQQLRPHERRMTPVVETAESPFRVIAGVRVPEPAPSRTSVPSPSAATAPAAAPIPGPAPVPPADELLPSADLPSEVPRPSWVRRRADGVVARTPEPARGGLGVLVSASFDAVHKALATAEYDRRTDEAHAVADPVYEGAVGPTRPAREAATADAQGRLDAVRG